jgi:hypothetical protein
MGQFWMIANLDKKQTIGSWFGLRWLFNGKLNQIKGWLLKKLNTSWAGDRIICAGYYMSPGNLPDGLFTKEEIVDHKLDNDALNAIASSWSMCLSEVPEPESLPLTNKSSGTKRML